MTRSCARSTAKRLVWRFHIAFDVREPLSLHGRLRRSAGIRQRGRRSHEHVRHRRAVQQVIRRRGSSRRAPGRDARPDERSRPRQRGRRPLPRPRAVRREQGVAVLARPRAGLGPSSATGWPPRSAATTSPRCAPATRSSWPTPTPPARRPGWPSTTPELRIMSAGERIEIFKEMGTADGLRARASRSATSRAATRSATRAWRPRAASPPSTRIRSRPAWTCASSTTARCPTTTGCAASCAARASSFQTDNDTEVAAGYLTWRLREGATLEGALESCLSDLDGFYTFAVGTADGFAVLRDPIACKPAVMAETDEWVAMASEYRAIAVLPGAEEADRVGARAGQGVQLGAGARLMSGRDPASPSRPSTWPATPRRELNARLHALAGDGRARRGGRHALARAQPQRRPRAGRRPRRAASRSRSRATSATTARA